MHQPEDFETKEVPNVNDLENSGTSWLTIIILLIFLMVLMYQNVKIASSYNRCLSDRILDLNQFIESGNSTSPDNFHVQHPKNLQIN